MVEELKNKIQDDIEEIEKIEKEVYELLQDKKVLRYDKLTTELRRRRDRIKRNSKLLNDEIQENCNHKSVCFKSLNYRQAHSVPLFLCLKCGKTIYDYLEDDQVCLNEQYVFESSDGLYCESDYFKKILLRYSELSSLETNEEEIQDIIKKEFSRNSCSKIKIRKSDFK